LRGTIVAGNTFRDLVGGTNSALAGVALYGISSGGYQIADTLIVHNHYRNSRTSPGGEQYGFVYLYVAEQTVIANNVGVGSWTPTEPTIGPWLAPGRTDKENIGLIVTGNTIRGFDAPWDPDSMAEVEVAHNVVHACGTGFDLGYGTQRYVRIHDNIMVNSPHHSYGAAVLFANSTPVKCEVADNLYIDDRATPAMTKAIELTGNSDFCDVVVRGNRFYTPSGTITSPLFYHEQGNEVLPRVVEGNEVHDETGIRWFGAEQGASLATKTSAYTLITTDSVIVADATAGAFTVTLPSAAGIAGRQYTIKRTNGGGNNVTVGSMGGQTIDGASTKILGAQFSYLTVLSDGSAWQIVGQGGMVG
jgi:hypothetical protein